jgi:hypothetical protein
VWRGLRKVIYLVPSNTAVAMVDTRTAQQPTDADADTCSAIDASAKPGTAPPAQPPAYADLPQDVPAFTVRTRPRLFSGRFTFHGQKAHAGRSETEEEATREPSQLPSEPPLGESEIDAAAPRDGDVFKTSRSMNAYI